MWGSIKPSVFKGRRFNGRRTGLGVRRGLCRAVGISTMKSGTLRLNSTTSCGGGGVSGPGGWAGSSPALSYLGAVCQHCCPCPHATSAGQIAPAGSGRDTSGSRAEAARAGASPASLPPVFGLNIIFLLQGGFSSLSSAGTEIPVAKAKLVTRPRCFLPPRKGAFQGSQKSSTAWTGGSSPCQYENLTTQQVEGQIRPGISVCCGGWGKEGMGWWGV